VNELGFSFLVLAALFLLVVLAVVALGVRRYQLRRALGTFDASLSMRPGSWTMGVCRYGDNDLVFLRLLSLTPIPRYRFVRSSLQLNGWRQPEEAERGRIAPGAVIVQLGYEGSDFELAMKYDVYAGLSSWLEAGPVVGVGTWR
jgi:hypothetical protein